MSSALPQGSAEPLSILGASARAASASAVRAGFAVCAVDLFADDDTAQVARAIRIDDFPEQLLAIAPQLPDAPWIYTGGLENYPELVDAIAARRPLWGNSGDVLRRARDPRAWTEVARAAGLKVPRLSFDLRTAPRDGGWLAKPLRSSGGLGIQIVDAEFDPLAATSADMYFQERIVGALASAVYVAAGRKARLLGTTQQLSGAAWTGAPAFVYGGSIGPISPGLEVAAALESLGHGLAAEFALTGLFGVDGIVNDAGFWPIEINPRYVASIEVLERATGANFVQFHAAACRDAALPPGELSARGVHGKAILYAQRPARFGAAAAEWVAQAQGSSAWPQVADIPRLGERFPAGSPVATLLAAGASIDEVAARLQAQTAALWAALET